MPLRYQDSRYWNINAEAKSGLAYSGRTCSGYFTTYAILCQHNGVERNILKGTLNIDEVTTTQGSQCTLSFYGHYADRPQVGDEILIAYSTWANVLFKGQITDIVTTRLSRGQSGVTGQDNQFQYDVTCTNYMNLLGRLLVFEYYANRSVAYMIRDIVKKYAPGFTVQSIPKIAGEDTIIPYWFIDRKSVIDAITDLCDASYLFWFVTNDKVVRVQTKEYVESNLSLEDGGPHWDSLSIEEDWSQVRNRVYVRGAQNLNGTDIVETFTADGTVTQKFTLQYKPLNTQDQSLPPVITAPGQTITVGFEGIDPNDGSYTLMVNYENKTIRYGTGITALPSGTIITVTYQYYIPTLAVVENQTAQQYAYQRELDENGGRPTGSLQTLAATMYAVTFGGGKFVACGFGGAIFTSPDGLTWTSRTSPVGVALTGIAYGNGTYVCVGALTGGQPAIVYSSDGVTWQQATTSVTVKLNAIAFGAGRFVAVGALTGSEALILYSSDGVNWTGPTFNFGNAPLNGICYGGGQFVAVGNNGSGTNGSYVTTSADGTSWTMQTSPTTTPLVSVTYGNGLYVAVGNKDDYSPLIMTSPDGVVWTRRTNTMKYNLQWVFYAAPYFYTADGGPTISETFRSGDGITWEQWITPPTKLVYGMTIGGTVLVMAGYEVTTFGAPFDVHESLVDDSSLTDLQSAYQRGRAELQQFCYPLIKGSFTTQRPHFQLGDYIQINLSDRPSYRVFIYERITTPLGTNRLGWEIRFTDSQRDRYVDLMQQFVKKGLRTNTQRVAQSEDVAAVFVDNF